MSAEILIIDDNSDIREILNDLIVEAGYSTRLAANYNQALTEIDKKLPDVAIIDVKLDKGDSDGIQLLDHIKQKNNDIPVIMIWMVAWFCFGQRTVPSHLWWHSHRQHHLPEESLSH